MTRPSTKTASQKRRKKNAANNPSLEGLVGALRPLMERMEKNATTAVAELSVFVPAFRMGFISDENQIGRILDQMLDFGFSPQMTGLFKEACRALLPGHPQLVADYVSFYKEIRDGETPANGDPFIRHQRPNPHAKNPRAKPVRLL